MEKKKKINKSISKDENTVLQANHMIKSRLNKSRISVNKPTMKENFNKLNNSYDNRNHISPQKCDLSSNSKFQINFRKKKIFEIFERINC